MPRTLAEAVSRFGAEAASKLSSPAATGAPEDQLRAPLETLLKDLAELAGVSRRDLTAVGESSLGVLQTRPDYAVAVGNALIGFIEVKAPGKGADPREFRDRHDRAQWVKLQSLPNLLYTDGNEFSLWRSGELVGEVLQLVGDIREAGPRLAAPARLVGLVEAFLQWRPVPPRTAKELAETTARLCRLLRDETAEQLALGSPALTALARDWRKLLFPMATEAEFADGYAQAVTFGLLIARARDIRLSSGMDRVARELGQSASLIGTALRLLTDDARNQKTLKTSLDTLVRVLDVVDWPTIERGRKGAWLYFYEDFLEHYDNELRKQTGSYYTPAQVVECMVELVDEVLRDPNHFGRRTGLADPTVTVADPAAGTGTFLLAVLSRVAATVEDDLGPGAVPAAIGDVLRRLIGFELQLGPFAVAQMRLLAELSDLTGDYPIGELRMYVTDTLGNPYVEEEWFPAILGPIAESRTKANQIKRDERITVVIGNPPYKDQAGGRGGWVESGSENSPEPAPLLDWMPPPDWGVSVHARHLRNLYVYFWRWATWKVFGRATPPREGVVCFITVAGFLGGSGFQRMRDYMRRTADDIWIIDCSPEGHRPEVNTRIFQGVQQPICVVLMSRSGRTDSSDPASVRYHRLPEGHRDEKFRALRGLQLQSASWEPCPSDWRSPFLPRGSGAWPTFPALDDFFTYNGTGVMAGRTWHVGPDRESLIRRWDRLVNASAEEQRDLFHPHMRRGQPGDRHADKVVTRPLGRFATRQVPVSKDQGPCVEPIRYGFRSFDRQWIIPDNRLINQPNPRLWDWWSEHQVHLTAPMDRAPTGGPALTFTSLIPDVHHYNNRGGRVFPLWSDRLGRQSNLRAGVRARIEEALGEPVSAPDVMAYIAAIAASPAYTDRFSEALVTPGLRIPLTSNPTLFRNAVALGRRVIWLQTFGDSFADVDNGRPKGPPRLSEERAPRIPRNGAIPPTSAELGDQIDYLPDERRLTIAGGHVDNVSPDVWAYEVSGKQVLRQWFSYRRASRDRPIIGGRRPPSSLNDIQSETWLSEYTSELLATIHVLTLLVDLQPAQAELLESILAEPLISRDELEAGGAFDTRPTPEASEASDSAQESLF